MSGSKVDLDSATGDVTLGTLTTSGELTVTARGGGIAQEAGATLTVDGNTTLAASTRGVPADISLTNVGDRLVETVNAAGAQVSLDDSSPMTLGTVTATGNLTVDAKGPLNLGTTTVGGSLAVSSDNGNITQSGPLRVDGSAKIVAGTGDIDLDSASNVFMVAATGTGSVVLLGDTGVDLAQYVVAGAAVTGLESSAAATTNVAVSMGELGPSLEIIDGGVRLPAL
jgi:hypothetical protein